VRDAYYSTIGAGVSERPVEVLLCLFPAPWCGKVEESVEDF